MHVTFVDKVWPYGTPQTDARDRRDDYRFLVTAAASFKHLSEEVRLWDVMKPILGIDVIKSNKTGRPIWLSLPAARTPAVALSFKRQGKRITLALDTYNSAAANLRAIGLTVAAMRSIDRYGADVLLDRMVAPIADAPAINEDVIYLSKG